MAFLELFEIVKLFSDEPKLVQKGENAVQSQHVLSVTTDTESGIIFGQVQASMKDKTYDVKVCKMKTNSLFRVNSIV